MEQILSYQIKSLDEFNIFCFLKFKRNKDIINDMKYIN